MQQYHGLREMDGQRNGMETGTCIHLHIHHLRNNLFSTKILGGGHLFLLTYFPDFVCPIYCAVFLYGAGVLKRVLCLCVSLCLCVNSNKLYIGTVFGGSCYFVGASVWAFGRVMLGWMKDGALHIYMGVRMLT